jgi:hypothetical protein
MANQLNGSGITLDSLAPSDIETGGTGKVLLYASGSGAASRLYVKSGANTQALLGTDLDTLTAVDAVLAASDLLLFSDQSDSGVEKAVTMANVSASVFAGINGDASIASTGVLTIAADAVHGTMLNTDAADGSTMELSSDSLSVLKVPNSLTVDNATIQLNSGTTYDGAAARTISIKDGGVDADALASSVAGTGIDGGGGSALSVSAAQTAISSLKHDSLVIGRSSGNDDITFSDDTIDLMTNNASRLKVQTTNTTISNNLIVEGNLTIEGSAVEVQQGFVVTASIQFEGSTPDGNELTLTTANPTADRTVTIPDLDGHVPLLAGAISTANVTAAEFALLDGGSSIGTTAVADGHGIFMNQGGTMGHTTVQTLAAYLDDEITAMPNLVTTAATTVGALDAGSITSNFGAINVGTSNISGGTISGSAATFQALSLSGVEITSTAAELNLLDGVSGLVKADFTKLAAVDATAAELNIVDGGTSATATTLADADRVVVNDNGTMVQVALTDFETYFESALDTLSNVTTVGALDAGSITSNFGAIDVGTSDISGRTLTGTAVSGSTVSAQTLNLSGVEITSTAAELNVLDGATVANNTTGKGAILGTNGALALSSTLGIVGGGAMITGSVYIDGDIELPNNHTMKAQSFVTYSDRELKKNIEPMGDALDKVMKLEAVTYDMKSSGKAEIGFIAQDVAKVVPEVCALDNMGVGRGIDYSRVSTLLVGAIKSQQEQIADLMEKLDKLQK